MQNELPDEENRKSTTKPSESGSLPHVAGEPKVILAICTLQYEKKTVDCLLSVMTDRIFDGWVIPECCLLPQNRNKAIAAAYRENEDFTHIMFIDDDMNSFTSQHVAHLWKADKPIIQGLTVARKPPYTMIHFQDEFSDAEMTEKIKAGELCPSKYVGMAFTLIKREVLDATREETPDGPVWFTTDRDPREGWDGEVARFIKDVDRDGLDREIVLRDAIELGRYAHIGSCLSGEDVNFCRRAKNVGFDCWTHLGVHIGHIGSHTFDWRHALAHEYGSVEDEEATPSIVTP